MPIFKLSQIARKDLVEIGAYTEDNWGIDKRNEYLDDLDERFNLLAENPDYPASKEIGHIKQSFFR